MEKLIVGAIVVACLIYVVLRARRTFKSNGCGCGCGGGAEKKSCGCAGCNGCNGGEKGESSGCGCGRSE
ncbi:MAG: FeoB-associated Cys-rich membrane protein [Thermoguttaceae bacterium]|nr:FeoB-associated Cys-rich membrane protein [Thermoguttaceae bacterium]